MAAAPILSVTAAKIADVGTDEVIGLTIQTGNGDNYPLISIFVDGVQVGTNPRLANTIITAVSVILPKNPGHIYNICVE